MKIAFTTNDSVHINAHFGSAKQIDVYEVDPTGSVFVESLTFGGNLNQDGNEDKLEPKIKALADCTIIYVVAIGGGAAARLIGRNITPIKAQSDDAEIQDVLTRLVQTLNGSPPPWLRKALLKNRLSQAAPPDKFEDDLDNTADNTVEEVLV
ncbi:nitrogen fixation protein NifX [Synechococcus sp. PCC 7335]|uniref:nitrogen fixation protein NifX n=1 Tax=Synechococcus sp. (strain ATCC 29403 / PCC 7335) TaxID=91464 RepID=UPI00017EC077|nr:nitrogen fixation protein NifX [Synechococcus sp. PCC 7335]EDX86496.1 nitrogen fixation protein NifX [Synechococcus sp. PCC 7335]